MKLLIADDHALNLKLLRLQLESLGHQVVQAEDGVEALALLEAEALDGVVSDILMPRMDGYRLCMEVRSRPAIAHLPFVLYTSTYNSPADRQLAESVGADDYISKPAPTENILAALRSAAESRGAGGAPANAIDEPAPVLRQYNEVLVRKLEEKGLELERTQEGLLESQARLEGMISSAMDAIIAVDESHCIRLFNDAAGRMFGCDPEQAMGRPINQFIPPRYRDAHDHHLELFALEQQASRRMGTSDVMGLRADGTEFPIEANISRLQTSRGMLFTAFIRDVTEQRRARDALRASEAALQRAQDLAQLSHAIINAKGEVESRSDSFATLLGVAPAALPRNAAEWLAYVHDDDRERVAALADEARRTRQRVDFQYRLRRGGEWRRIRQILDPLPDDHAHPSQLRTFNTMQDITEQHHIESKVRQLNRVYAVLSEINSLIVRATDRDELFQQACRILIGTGRFAKAWIGLVDEGVDPVRMLGWAGAPDAFFEDLQRRLSKQAADAGGLLAKAMESGLPAIANDVAGDPTVVQKKKLLDSGSLSFAIFPLVIDARIVGVLSIHAAQVDFFDEEETRLLVGLAGDIAFALDHMLKSDHISYLAGHDALTGLPNRMLAAELLMQHIAGADRGDRLVCVAIVDLVRFRRINETLGRRAGDELLQQVAMRLRGVDPFVARLGPDQFALQLVDRRSPAELARDFEHISRACFDEHFIIGTDEVRIGCRIGAAVFPADGDDAESLFRNAESALRQAKSTVEPFVFYEPGMNTSANEALAMESKLRRAIERGEFVLHYQPKVRFSDRRVCGVEALIRWQDPEGGLVPPMRFIPVLEETGLIGAVGHWALGQALRDLAGWKQAGAAPIRVAVNVSPLQLNQANFAAQIAQLVAGESPDSLELEITESVIMEDVDRKISMLGQIRDLGVCISVDDFGTGYSSLAYIARLPITSLKIDRAFVTGMTESPEGYVLVSSIIALAHALKLKVVAEGVETEEQANLLKLLACDEAQGYLFSKPVPADRLQALLLAGGPLPSM